MLRLEGAEFIEETIFNGVEAFKWDKPGLQHNYYYETSEFLPTDRVMLGIDQQPNDFQVFDPATFARDYDEAKLALPASCKPNKSCSLASICTAVKYA